MRFEGRAYFILFLVVVGLYCIISSLAFARVQAKAIPLAVASLVFILATMELVRVLRTGNQAATRVKAEPKEDSIALNTQLRRFGLALAWVVGFSLGVYLVGFVIAMPVFVFSYLKSKGRGWLISAVLAVLTIALIYGMFQIGLRSSLYRGILFGGR
ncbi:MAG: tripartite tricarboxylate transporter TctB family protein [Chloroflexota bacterium]